MQKPKVARLSSFLPRSRRIFCTWFLVALFFSVSLSLSPHIARIPPSIAQEQLAPSELVQQGQNAYETGNYGAAVAIWQQAVVAFESQGDVLNRAIALSNLSLTYQKLGEWNEARQAIAESLQILQQNLPASNPALAQSLDIQGLLYLSTGKAQAALDTWKQATAIYERVGDRAGKVRSQLNQAQAMQVLGLHLQARKMLAEVNQVLSAAADSRSKVKGLRSLGNVLRQIGELEASQQRLQESLAVAQRLQLDSDISATELDLGNTDRALWSQAKVFRDAASSQNYLQSARQRYAAAAASESPSVRLKALLNQLSLRLATERWEEAKSLLAPLQSAIAQFPPSRAKIFAQIKLAQGQMALATSPRDIAKNLAIAWQQAKEMGDVRAESLALGALGALYEQAKQWPQMQEVAEQSLGLAQSINAPDLSYRWQWQLGRAYRHLGKRQSAIAAYTEAIKTLKIVRQSLIPVDPDLQFSFRENVEPVYRQFVDLLLQSDPQAKDLNLARETLEKLQVAELEDYLQCSLLANQSVKIDTLADLESAGVAIIYPAILKDRADVILKLPQQPLRHAPTRVARTEVDRTITDLRRALLSPARAGSIKGLSQKLYNWFIQPIQSELKESHIQTLVFVLDGDLRNIPMAVLYDGRQYLIEKYAIALAPGLQLLDPQPLVLENASVLMGGLSEARHGSSALKYVEAELNNIQAQVSAQVLLNSEFTSTALQRAVRSSPFSIVHLATHGQFSSQLDKTFILSWDKPISVEELRDLLRSREENLSQAIELLVLSACQTAKGDKRAILGLAGIAVRSGARSTIGSLWNANDESASMLMSRFYREFANPNITKVEALRRSQSYLLQETPYKSPRYWAPYVLVGNWF